MFWNILFWVFLIVHIILCIILYLGTRARVFHFSEQLLPIIFCVPIFGMAVAVVADYNSRRNKTGSRSIDLEEMHIALGDYRLIKLDEDESANEIVPLEEAMSINDADTRRKLMTDILHQNPNEYVRLLQQARLNDDLEVTHYASTAIMEIQREYEIDLQSAEKEYNAHPEQAAALDTCIEAFQRYIKSGLIEDNVLFIHRKRYASLLEVKLKQDPNAKLYFLDAVDNYLDLGDYGSAKLVVDQLTGRWPADESAWFAKLKLCQQTNDGVALAATVSEIKRRNVYLSPEGKALLSFWDQSRSEENSHV